MATLQKKSMISAQSALLFVLVSLPATYRLTDRVLPYSTFDYASGCPTPAGILTHTVVFYLLTYLSMGMNKSSVATKVKHSLYATLIFFLVSNPATYALVGSVLGGAFADANGCATVNGVLLHGVVYFALLVAVMYLP